MTKKEIVLKVMVPEEDTFMAENYKFEITVWEKDSEVNYMIDDHLVEHFPELEQYGIEDLQEGFSGYNGDLTIERLVDVLQGLGFTTFYVDPQSGKEVYDDLWED